MRFTNQQCHALSSILAYIQFAHGRRVKDIFKKLTRSGTDAPWNYGRMGDVYQGRQLDWHDAIYERLWSYYDENKNKFAHWIIPAINIFFKLKEDPLFNAMQTIFPRIHRYHDEELQNISANYAAVYRFARYRNKSKESKNPILYGVSEILPHVSGEPFLRFKNKIAYETNEGNKISNSLDGLIVPHKSVMYFLGTDTNNIHPVFISTLRQHDIVQEFRGIISRKGDQESGLMSGRILYLRTKNLFSKEEEDIGFISEEKFKQIFKCSLKAIKNCAVNCPSSEHLAQSMSFVM